MYKRLKQSSQFNYQFFQLKHNLKVYNKILKRIIREAKLTYYNLQFKSCQSDPRKTWDNIRSLLNNSKSKGFPDYMNINNVKINDKNIIVDKINEYFGNIGNTMANTIPIKNKYYRDYLNTQIHSTFKFEPVSEAKVQLIIKNLKSKSSFGHDNISTKILLKLLPILCQPLTLIINQSVKTGKFPDRLKIAKIIPKPD